MNKVILIGRVGTDPEVAYSAGGSAIVRFRLCTERRYNGENEPTWHTIKAFGKLAETVAKYVAKGNRIALSGRISTFSWVKDNVTHEKFEIIMDELDIIDYPKTVEQVIQVGPDENDIPF